MISTLEKEITFRFLKARKKDGFLNVISIFSFIGISLGVAVLIIVMSVMNGFRTELINKIVGFNSHITVKPYSQEGIDLFKLNNKNLRSISKNLIFSNSGEAIILKNNTSPDDLLRAVNNSKHIPLDPIYLFFTADMTSKYGAISKLGSWDIVKGGSNPSVYQNLNTHLLLSYHNHH